MFQGIEHLGLFMAAGIMLNLTPGPDVLFIMTQSLKSGWRAGAVAALGITTGCFVHIGAAALGLSALMAASSTAFAVLKWLGAAYLILVGLHMLGLRVARPSRPIGVAPDSTRIAPGFANIKHAMPLKTVFFRGFWTNALNPKVALFFLAFLPQFITPDATHKTLAFVLLGLIFNFNGLWVNLGYASLGAALARRVTALQFGLRWLECAAGVLFIGFGLKLALTENPPL